MVDELKEKYYTIKERDKSRGRISFNINVRGEVWILK